MTSHGAPNEDAPDIAKGRTDWRSNLARVGLAAKGVLYLAFGFFAIDLVTGVGNGGDSEQGAIELVASQPFGRWVLGVLTFGLLALAVWRAIVAVTGDPVEGSETSDRIMYAGRSLLYLGTTAAAASVLVANWNGGSGGGNSSGPEEATGWVMGLPLGPWLVGAAGLVTIGYVAYSVKTFVVDADFMSRLTAGEMRPTTRRAVETAGRVGYGARAGVMSVVGVFLVVAALQHDPSESRGLSGALKTLAGEPWGQAVLWAVAVGLLLFGVFCFAEGRYRRAG